MKILFIILIVLKLGVATADHFVVSPNQPEFFSGTSVPPVAGQNLYLWMQHPGCWTTDYTTEPETQVDVIGNNISVFLKNGLGGNTVCASPPPPWYVQVAEINGLNVGVYNLSSYSIPFEDVFPPAVVDYPVYFFDSIQFGVFQAPAIIDSTTNISLVILILLILLTGFYFNKQKFHNIRHTQ